MPSTIKRTGVVGSLLAAMAQRGGNMTADHRGFPPSSVFAPLRQRGLATMTRQSSGPRMRYTVWSLTPRGWDASGDARPQPAAE